MRRPPLQPQDAARDAWGQPHQAPLPARSRRSRSALRVLEALSCRRLGRSLRSPSGLLLFLRLYLLEGCLSLPGLTAHLFAGSFEEHEPSSSAQSWAQAWFLLPILITATRMPLIVHLLFECSHIVNIDDTHAATTHEAMQVLWGYTAWVCPATSVALSVWYFLVLCWLFTARSVLGDGGLPHGVLVLIFFSLLVTNVVFCICALVALSQQIYPLMRHGGLQRFGSGMSSVGLARSVSSSDASFLQLRVFKFGDSGDGSEKLFEPMCTICLLDFEVSEEVRQLPCRHLFHTCCIDPWLRKRGGCPLGCNRAAPLWERRVVPASADSAERDPRARDRARSPSGLGRPRSGGQRLVEVPQQRIDRIGVDRGDGGVGPAAGHVVWNSPVQPIPSTPVGREGSVDRGSRGGDQPGISLWAVAPSPPRPVWGVVDNDHDEQDDDSSHE